MKYFTYSQDALDYLSKQDPELGKLIHKVGMIQRVLSHDLFSGLVESIIAQQISGKAAQTISDRLMTLVETMTPEVLMKQSLNTLRSIGISERKATYLLDISRRALQKEFDFNRLSSLDDASAIALLDTLPGVGVWTAEMLLIFCLERPNIFSYNDFAVKKGLMKLHGHKTMSVHRFERYRKKYSPYGSVASFYLWHLANDSQ
jgi:3-methyladenine DNA glycosylase/8-oxoguanine DNA glycosylase